MINILKLVWSLLLILNCIAQEIDFNQLDQLRNQNQNPAQNPNLNQNNPNLNQQDPNNQNNMAIFPSSIRDILNSQLAAARTQEQPPTQTNNQDQPPPNPINKPTDPAPKPDPKPRSSSSDKSPSTPKSKGKSSSQSNDEKPSTTSTTRPPAKKDTDVIKDKGAAPHHDSPNQAESTAISHHPTPIILLTLTLITHIIISIN